MKLEEQDGTLQISGVKELSAANANTFRDWVRKNLAERHKNIEIDLEQTTFVDSCGLGAMVALHKTLCARNGRLRLLNAQPSVRQILELTRLNRILDVVPT